MSPKSDDKQGRRGTSEEGAAQQHTQLHGVRTEHTNDAIDVRSIRFHDEV